MIGVRYRVVPKDGDPWEFVSDLADECRWEAYAVKARLPVLPEVDRSGNAQLGGFPMMTNAAVLAWAHSGVSESLDSWRAKQVEVMPVSGDDEGGLPDPTPPGPGPG